MDGQGSEKGSQVLDSDIPSKRFPKRAPDKLYWEDPDHDTHMPDRLLSDAMWNYELASRAAIDSPECRRATWASVLAAFAAFEAHVNDYCYRLVRSAGSDLGELERNVCDEKYSVLREGQFKREKKNYPLEDRYTFLYTYRHQEPLNKTTTEWRNYLEAKRIRDQLTHPKPPLASPSPDDAKQVIEAVQGMLRVLLKDPTYFNDLIASFESLQNWVQQTEGRF
ncbi:hypothetical protein KOR34_19650 [Posidoniimonas corsicana]|uniref:Uncharacterized protein n=1 Tax=Posidoniimonas corsicana TaxID=1938618 RepID=A0A5C5VGJ3_9BACT|nr:hypothetical protein [Posidoniimonas corsicana]TWT37019.1 hypothetical protein KOR34_19650 [Posidoniimonas corsicana]